MTTGKALDGKPYAGNPHVAPSQCYMHRRGEASEGTLPKATRRARKRVRATGRFDEGEVASAEKPRRGSLLYKTHSRLLTAALVAGMAHVLSATDYYVDANNGNDDWDGTAAVALAKVDSTIAQFSRARVCPCPCAEPSDAPVPYLAPEARHVAACRAF